MNPNQATKLEEVGSYVLISEIVNLEKQLERYLHPGNIKREETCRNLETYSNEEDMDTSE